MTLHIPYHTLPPSKPHALPSSPATLSSPPSALIVGAGLAGLAAATHLHSTTNTPFTLLDASNAVGGRVRTDVHDGFLLDRGFQIFLTAYPEARRLLHYPSLNLQPFYPGALIYYNRQFHRIADPFRRPLDIPISLSNPIGTLPDKLLVGISRLRTAIQSDIEILTGNETTILDRLTSTGFSPSIINRFFKPFLGGIFFDKDLSTSSRLYDFIIKCLALGDNALPANGIGAIPMQLAKRLPKESILLNSKVVSIQPGKPPRITLENGDILTPELGVIVAVEQPEAEKLLPLPLPSRNNNNKKNKRSTVCLYFSADRAAVKDPILILNGSGEGIVNNMFFATNVAKSYGREGKVLVSVSVIGECEGMEEEEVVEEVVKELSGWFGEEEVRLWRHLRSYRIGFAQPDQSPPTDFVGKEVRVGEGVYVCGDWMCSATFDGALVSGRRAAEALVEDWRLSKAQF